jgi:hypothetical protein
LLLANDYPSQPERIAETLLTTAAAKQLRLYLEYPAGLPGLADAPARPGRWERAVVTSEFFGADLPPLCLLTINGLTFVPALATRPHLVAARVAGFDTAVYGLPKETHALLFEHPEGRVLVATTALSRFITGRYAPKESWQALWSGILAWLRAGGAARELNWAPLVRPTYGREEPLPGDAERRAFQRGVEWFQRSKLLLPASRLEAVDRAARADGLLPTPQAEAPSGDGSLGILEALLSVIQSDGSQMQSVARRGDCTAESAMALAFAGRVLKSPEYLALATNLLDFWYFTSDAGKRERADPHHGAYGLLAWGISSPAWYVANYGDDNARLMLGTLAGAALAGSDRWDEPVLRCVLANLRTTGKLGFRGDRLDLGPLGKSGWRPFFEREETNFAPHYESYLWACYLWAYRQTGFDLFKQRALTAIKLTMEAYPARWRWTNGLQQERARMLLPLAWLIRVEDTGRHRAWLRRVAKDLLALQDPSGAIQEAIGALERGQLLPPQSNEQYGSGEAPLLQRNGDPVCDLLYTCNFALLGLHEAAAATRDPFYRAAEDRLAQFLCRSQVRSEARPELDGGWFRAFDFKRWEHWGSNADAGWGAWSMESGWTQGWITSVLALRQLGTSLWELTAASRIERHFTTLCRAMLPEQVPGLSPRSLPLRSTSTGQSPGAEIGSQPSPSLKGF